ncbi:hypothetical protein ACFQRL_14275 [Microbacterium fluvii]|uniref:Uncharacterized protein n=1 Tax=Microbacterium fluvii TaxID=415215 RepID=A0ABW2HHQ4_9MICO|nr:hypothetical protein [Microbacterium fluvii]MCU4673757.1 hypothetical protein [Microbacterium fluvii]
MLSEVGPSAGLTITDGESRGLAHAHSLHFGSQDLVRVAGFAARSGFTLVRFYLADAYLQPLPAGEDEELSDELVEIFQRDGDREVVAALDDDFDGLFVVGIELRSHATGLSMLLRRKGYIDTPVKDEATTLLTAAWQKLHLT